MSIQGAPRRRKTTRSTRGGFFRALSLASFTRRARSKLSWAVTNTTPAAPPFGTAAPSGVANQPGLTTWVSGDAITAALAGLLGLAAVVGCGSNSSAGSPGSTDGSTEGSRGSDASGTALDAGGPASDASVAGGTDTGVASQGDGAASDAGDGGALDGELTASDAQALASDAEVLADAKSWYPQDISFASKGNAVNPYLDVTDFKVTFAGPEGAKVTLPGFYVGGQVWKVRFAPTSAGTFTYVTSSTQDPSLDGITGTVPPGTPNPNGHGAIHVDPSLPHHYVYDDGTRYFQMGYEIDWLALMDFGDATITKAKTIIDMIAANGFSEVNLQVYAYDTSWKSGITSAYDFGPTAQFPWAGTNAAPDNGKMNEAFWQNYDRVIAYLFQKGINAHIFCKFVRTYGGNELVGWPAHYSAEENLYLTFLTARYQAYSNVSWDLIKESFQETDQVYIASRLNLVKSVDAYHRLRTLHCSGGAQDQFHPNYYDVPAYDGTVDLYTDEHTTQYASAVAAWKKRPIPYLNAEVTQYQIGNDGTYAYKGDSKEAVFATNMEVLMAGGYFSYYYSLQAWDIVRWNETPDGITWYRNLATFMKITGWYNMAANDALIGGGAIGTHCLANPGKEYIVYKSGQGEVTLNVTGATAPLSARWVDLYTGTQSVLADQGNGSHTFTNPSGDPALLYLASR